MKILIASDIHGSRIYAQRVVDLMAEEGAAQLVLLGDIYNHGPRNPLPDGYDPMGVAAILNAQVGRLTVIKGNCDSDVDTLISDFEFVSEGVLFVGGKKIFLQHGDRFSIDALPKNCGDAFLYGHYHTGFIERRGGVLVANCGSVSLPKNGTPRSYLLLAGAHLALKDLVRNRLAEADICSARSPCKREGPPRLCGGCSGCQEFYPAAGLQIRPLFCMKFRELWRKDCNAAVNVVK